MTQTDPLNLDHETRPRAGELTRLSPMVRRLVVNNPGPMTFSGTCTYLVGDGPVAVIDPGPDDVTHRFALLDALAGERLAMILVTHTHRDHSPGAHALKVATGAPIVGCAPYAGAAGPRLDAGHDRDYAPDHVLADGEGAPWSGPRLSALATPGHAANHLAFVLPDEQTLFSGDHVMAWSTTVVVPPDGAMGAYMASLDRLRGRPETIYWPGHGGPVRDPQRFVRGLIGHRRHREAAIRARIASGDSSVTDLVTRLYVGLDPALHPAAAQSVLAHVVDLVDRGLVRSDRPPALDAVLTPA